MELVLIGRQYRSDGMPEAEFVIRIRTKDVRAAFETGFRVAEMLEHLPEDVEWDVEVGKT